VSGGFGRRTGADSEINLTKAISIVVDQQSWTSAPPGYRKTCPFPVPAFNSNINFGRAMLRVGMMSVSPRMPQWWVASYWAVLRYFAAVDETVTALRLHEAVDDLDTHPKKVLSDDWGTGVAIEWLDARFQYQQVTHGMSAMRELQSLGVATFAGKKKRGPQKCPDFLCEDSAGMLHLVECKGNQQGTNASEDQFIQGRLQKANVLFTNEQLVGQRMVTGLAIANPKSNWNTTLTLTDPPPEDSRDNEPVKKQPHFIVAADEPSVIVAAMKRVTCLHGLLLSGFFDVAAKVFPAASLEQRIQDALVYPVTEFEANGAVWRGQVYKLIFPVPLKTPQGEPIEGITLRFGASPVFLANAVRRSTELVALPALPELDLRLVNDETTETATAHADILDQPPTSRRSFIQNGDSFIADLELI
jgi:hypothetical protein